MTPALSQATTLQAAFADDVSGYADGGCTAVEVWLTKLERHLETASVADTARLIEDRNVRLVAAAVQGGLLLSQGAERKAHFDHFKARLDLCQRFRVPVIVVAADFAAAPDPTALRRAVVSLAQAAEWAAGFGVKVALEFRGAAAFCNNLDTALTLVQECGAANAGVCLDVFHYYKGPSKPEDLDRLSPENLFHVQVSDVPGVPREVMGDADRVLPGEGDFRLDPVFARLKAIRYAGAVSVELMNPVLAGAKPSQVAELAMTALKRFA